MNWKLVEGAIKGILYLGLAFVVFAVVFVSMV